MMLRDYYVYKVGFYTCEESAYWELVHKDKFTKEELEKIVFESVDKAIKKVKRDNSRLVHCFEDIADIVVDIMFEEYGFKLLEYTTKWVCFGWGSLFKEDEWKKDASLIRLREFLRSRGYTEKDDAF